ncbi:MAG: DUF4091 domain-containing protein [Phycisphaerae bacterium]|nr:DUF4091 domain-containing protein [Phycisphaerae bacterium]
MARGEGRVTVIGVKESPFDYSKMSLGADVFGVESILKMTPRTKVELVESIDDSRLIVFHEQISADVFKAIFDDKTITAALTRILKRGGAIFFGATSWQTLKDLPASMREYFLSIRAFLPGPGHYKSASLFRGFANPAYSGHRLVNLPNRLTREGWPDGAHAVRYWAGFPGTVIPLLVDTDNPEKAVLLMQEKVLGKGRIFFSLSYSLTRRGQSAFFQNLVYLLYGKTPPASGASRSSRKEPTPLADAAAKGAVTHIATGKSDEFQLDGKLDDAVWKRANPLQLAQKYPDGGEVKKQTDARLAVVGDQLVLAVRAREPNLAGLKADIRTRDGELWKNDSIDMVFNVGTPQHPDLRQWIVSAAGTIFDAKRNNRDWNSGAKSAVGREAAAWTVELSIPLKDLFDGRETPPAFWVNLARHDQQTGEIALWIPTNHIPNPAKLGLVTPWTAEGFQKAVEKETKRAAAVNRRTGVVIWTVPPGTENLSPGTKPQPDQPAMESLSLRAPGRGHDSAVILITNFDNESNVFRVNHPKTITGPDEKPVPFEEVFTLYQGIPRLNSYQKIAFDPLVPIAPAQLVTIPGGETAMLWLDAKAPVTKGNYQTRLGMISITTLPKSLTREQWNALQGKTPPSETDIRVSLDVSGATLPDPIPVNTYTFGPYSQTGLVKEYADFARRFHITYLLARYPFGAITQGPTMSDNPSDYFDETMKILTTDGGKIIYSYNLLTEFDRFLRRNGFEGKMADPHWKKLFQEWMTHWMKALADNGVTQEQFYIQLQDEPHGEIIPPLVELAKLVKEHFPNAPTMVDIGSRTVREEIEALRPYVDLFIPVESRLTRWDTREEELAYYKKHGPFWTYQCSVRADVQSLTAYYRYRGVRDWLLGSDGVALFAFNSWRGDPWVQWDVISGTGFHDEGIVYPASDGPVPTMRIMEFRQGIEDFALLEMLRGKRNLPTREALRKRLHGTVLDPVLLLQGADPEETRQWRSKLLDVLEE